MGLSRQVQRQRRSARGGGRALIYDPTQPAGYDPAGWHPDDARRYEVMRRVNGGDDVMVAATLPGDLERVVTGLSDSDERYYVRAYNRVNLADRDPIDLDLRRVAFDGDGDLILPVPTAVRNLRLVAGPGGLVSAQWFQRSFRGAPAAATFNLYVATGAAAIDFNTPTHAGVVVGGRPRKYELGTFAHGTTVKAVVRAVSSAGGEEANTVEATVTADAQAPDAVTLTALEVTPS